MKRRLLSLLLAVVMVLGMLPTAALADNTPGTVRVIVENRTFTQDVAQANGLEWKDTYWSGELVNKEVALTEASTMMSCIGAALIDYDTEGLNSGYISSIHHLAAFDGGLESGWMGTLNDWFVNAGFDSFTVADGTLCAGDEIRVMYTRTGYGADLGGGYGTNQGYLSTLSASSGSLSPVFDKDTLAYTLTVPSGVDTVDITATAENKNDKITVSVGGTEYRRGKSVPVADDTQITVACGKKTYTVTVVRKGEAASCTVDFTMQENGAFLLAPQFDVAVSGDLAEQYGYADSVTDGVSALDVLVKAHVLKYPGFAENPQEYLALNEAGFLTTVFGAADSNFGFMVNGEMPNDGVLKDDDYAPGGQSYTGYSIAQCPVEDGDALEFFRYQDSYYLDNYGWAEYQGSRTSAITVRPDAAVSLSYKGFCVAYYGCVPMDTLENSGLVEGIEDAQLAWVSTETGALTDIQGALTSEDGKAAFTAPAEEGTYYLTAYVPAAEIANSATPLVLSLVKVVVDSNAPQPDTPAASADLTALSVADLDSNPKALVMTPAFDRDVTSYAVAPVNFQQYAKMAYVKATAASETAAIKATLNGTEKTVTSGDTVWTSFNNMQPGQDNVLTVTVTDGDLSKTYTVTIPMKAQTVAVTSISLDKTALTLTAGETAVLTATVEPDNATDKTVTWSSSDETVATVDNGTVTAVAAGNADITAQAGEKTAVCSVTVQAPLPDASITVPGDATLFVGEKTGGKHYVPFTEKSAAATVNNADGTVTYYYDLKTNSQYNYRISGEGYVTYAGVFKKTADYSLTVTRADLQPEGKTSKTVDHNVTSNSGYNVADIYLNINAQNYLKLAEVGDTYQLVNLRNWEAVDTITSNYFIEPDYHYTVLNENGQADSSVVTVSDSGLITAKQAGTAIVLVTYDAINVISAAGGPFFGAIWPENTGVFVVSVGAQDSGITTGMTINEAVNEGLSFKNDGTALDAEHDVIYFLGESGSYTFTPGTEGVTVTVANPTVGETMTFSGFTGVGVTTEGGAVTVPLKEGRNIVKLEKDGKAEYQVITAKQVTVTINDGKPVKPGDTVSIKFSTVYHPINKLAGVYNYTPAIVYTQVEGCEGQMVGSKGSQYQFAAAEAAQTVSWFMTTKEQWGATMLATGAAFTIPADYAGDTLTLSGGTIGFGGWGSWAGEHRRITLEAGKLPNLNAASPFGYLGQLPDIVIPVEQPEIAVSGISLDKTELTLTVGGSETLTATVEPDNATDKTVTWTTSNAAVATVDNGTVTAVAAGNADITAQAGEKTAVCSVTVQAPLPDASITVPGDATLFVGEKTGGKHYVPFTEKPAAATVNNADGTVTHYYDLKTNSQYNYRISGEGYVTYAGVFKKTADYSLTVTRADLQPEGKTSKTVDHNVTSNSGYNVADIYLNINAQNYLKLAEVGDTYQLVNLRNWEAVDTTTSNYFIEPDYHYTVLNENGQADTSVVTVSDSGVVTAKQAGTAIVLVTYDAINVTSAAGGPFFGAIWPENTGVFVVSVGAQDSGITTGMTINEAVNEGLSFKNDGTALDAEHDVIYFLGESGSYTFTPGTEGVTVTVANPTVGEAMTFSGFTGEGIATEGGAVTVPLKEGRNIVKLEKDGKAEYQVITAKQLTVTINDGKPVKPGDTVSIKFSTVYHPINKLAGVYNYTPAIVYTQVEGCEGQMVGSKGSQYQFAAAEAAQTVSWFMTTKEQWGATMLSTGAAFTIPADYTGDTLTLSGGTIGFGGWGSWAGEHRRITLEAGKLPNLNAASPFGYLGQLPDLVIPVEQPEPAATPDEMYDASAGTLLNTEVTTGSVRGEWLMFGLARALDKEPTEAQKTAYLAAVKSYIESSINDAGQLHRYKSTDNSRIALALTALGYDPADFEGHDLLEAFGNTDWATQQGSTGTAFALLALRAVDYTVSNEQELINSLLNSQNADGGWAITTGSSDLDATAMVIQALAPDYLASLARTAGSVEIKTAVDNALAFLAGKMTDDGTVTDGTFPASAETIAQILVALTELGRNPAEDAQFIKNSKTLLDGLTTFYLKDQGFAHAQGGEFNQMATEQAFYALVAYDRFLKHKTSLYDMSDVRTYTITAAAANGTITVKNKAMAGESVVVTVEPNTGYRLQSLTMNGEKLVAIHGEYRFTMPAANVTLTAVFEQLNSVIEQETTVTGSTATVTISENAVDNAVEAVAGETDPVITIIPADTGNADKVAVEIPAASMYKIADADAALLINIPAGMVEIPTTIVEQIADNSVDESIVITVEARDEAHIEDENIPEDTTDAVIVEVTITKGDTEITNFGSSKLIVSIPVTGNFVPGRNYTVIVISDTNAEGEHLETLNGVCVNVDGRKTVQIQLSHLSTFVVLNPSVDNLKAQIEALGTVADGDASEATYEGITAIKTAYNQLSTAQKEAVKAEYVTFLAQETRFNVNVKAAIAEAKAELKTAYNKLKEKKSEYTEENWAQIQKLYDEAVTILGKARHQSEIDSILKKAVREMRGIATGEKPTVTFRLIGDFKHDSASGHKEYVTWIPTTTYTLDPGAAMYDVFVKAIADNGLSQKGASGNYVSSIKAPAVLGGYWLSEFDNGKNSGWMYTVNGKHPSVGLKDYVLEDGDRIIWHYVDDYTLEERSPSSKYYFRWLEAEDISPEAYAKKQEQQGAAGSVDIVDFNDVRKSDWFYDDVQYVVENGLFNGTSQTTFSPNTDMNRAMLVTVLYRLEGEPKVTGSSDFTDVTANQWYADAVIWANKYEIVNGYGNGKFGPTDSITREQMATILYRYAQYKNYSVKASNSLTDYSDYTQISPYALKALKWANAEGLINGRTRTTLVPQGTATRAEVAAILHRFVENVVNAD